VIIDTSLCIGNKQFLHKFGLFIVSPSTASLLQRIISFEASGDKCRAQGKNKRHVVKHTTNKKVSLS